MKKHFLITLPLALIMFISMFGFNYSLHSYYEYQAVGEVSKDLKSFPTDGIMDSLNNIQTIEESKQFASKIILNEHKTYLSLQKILINTANSAKTNFMFFTIFSATLFILICFLILGLSPIFKKGSNKASNRIVNIPPLK